jgi:hypothetical protein
MYLRRLIETGQQDRKEKKEIFMKSKIKTLVLGGLVASSLAISAAPAMAWELPWFHRDYRAHERWDDRRWGDYRGSRGDYDAYEQAHQQALYDASHGASRKKIAEDNAVADEILNRMHHR